MKNKIGVLITLSIIALVIPAKLALKGAEFKNKNTDAINFALYTADYEKRLILFEELNKLAKNGAIIINFTSYTCLPCRKEIPALEKIAEKHKNVRLWIIYTDSNIDEIKKSAKEIRIKSTVLVDGLASTAGKYGVSHTPTTFVIGKDRKIEAEIVGYSEGTIKKLEEFIKKR